MAKRRSGLSKSNKGNSKYSLPPSRNRHLQQEEQEAITKFHDVDNEFDDNNVKVWNEEELDRYDNLNENSKRGYEEVDNDDDSESEWTKPSAHEKLLSIFRKNKNKHFKKFYKREKLEQEGIELSEINNSEDEKEIEKPLGNINDNEEIEENEIENENENENENEGESENENEGEGEDEDEEEEDDDEEIGLIESEDENDENDTTDKYQLHFNEKVSEDISIYAAQVDTKEYEVKNFESPILKQCSFYNLKNKKITENQNNMNNLDELNVIEAIEYY
ncbi:hypothetical protein BCR32DRAFT_251032 [Anaeromyces robustus]|uniref:Uncharacterized protein n=1 Tax=Anaeromyces robustus TaxID=1754192 RepID=A0A1Y1VV00_9FUNG|nr:hypothetical protein BCR32DRAFT_251032 [Anaeromyces robustus]|eukprot:ORX64594.1 hypothetical protein BCR32DRAFT_251032 [Anaeromyces robustus]